MAPDPQATRKRLYGYTAIIISAISTGVMWVVLKDLMAVVSPLQANWLFIIPALVMVGSFYLLRRRGRRLVPRSTPLGWLALFASFAAAIFYLRNVGVNLTSATTAALVVRLELAFVFVMSYAVLQSRVTALGWIGTAGLLGGALLASGVGSSGPAWQPWGVLALATAALLTGCNALIIKLKFHSIPSEMPVTASCIMQSVVFTAALLVTGRLGETVAVAAQSPRIAVEGLLLGAMFAVSLFGYYYAMKRIPMWVCRILALLSTITAMVGDYVWLGSVITAGQLVGMAAVLGGAALVILSSRGAQDKLPQAV